MVQTRAGAKRSEWLQFIQEMAVLYRERHAACQDADADADAKKAAKARIRGQGRRRRCGSSNVPTVDSPLDPSDTSCPASR